MKIKYFFSLLFKKPHHEQSKQDIEQIQKCHCGEESIGHSFEIEILGVVCELEKSPMCFSCTRDYLNKHSTLCGSCFRPIFPGTAVGKGENPDYPYTHLSFDCSPSLSYMCGRWGEGRIKTLHELDPDRHPSGDNSIIENMLGGNPKIVASFEG